MRDFLPVTGEQLQARRKARGLSQRQLAIMLGVSPQTLGHWERGARTNGWPSVLRWALDAIEAQRARDGLLQPPSMQRD
jgi:transcriptional regulator with XRE-family HTH domain